MRCEDATVDIGSSLNGELDAQAEARLGEHLSGCPHCRREFEALREEVAAARGRGPAICVLNRKGRARLVACASCGELGRCARCQAKAAEFKKIASRRAHGRP